MGRAEEYKIKVDKFIELYNNRPKGQNGKPISNAEIARLAGWSPNRAHKTASELLSKPEIMHRIRQVEDEHEVAASLGQDSVSKILDDNIANMLTKLKNDPAKFVAAYKSLKLLDQEEEDDLDGFSIEELIRKLDQSIEDAQQIKERIRTEIREAKMSN